MADEKYIIGGILFPDEKSAERAKEEALRIKALNDNINYDNAKSVISLYQKAQKNHVFQTPVGVAYMLQLQEHMIGLGIDQDQIPPLELPAMMQNAAAAKEGAINATGAGEGETSKEPYAEEEAELEQPKAMTREGKVLEARLRAQKRVGQKQLSLIRTQWMVIAALAVIIIAMFVISMTGNNPTIINYRSKILNQYAEWEAQLEEREAAVTQRERAAGIDSGEGTDSGFDTSASNNK